MVVVFDGLLVPAQLGLGMAAAEVGACVVRIGPTTSSTRAGLTASRANETRLWRADRRARQPEASAASRRAAGTPFGMDD